MSALTLDDLDAALENEDHLGFGYSIASDLSSRVRLRLDKAVVAVANELSITQEQLFHWTNSKWGRWLVDGVYGRDESATKATVRNYLNDKAVREACDL